MNKPKPTTAMVSPDSPLRRLPRNLNRRQVMFTDALRLSAEMASYSYQNLERILKALVEDDRTSKIKGGAAIEAIVYAYGVIDASNRFREVLRSFPGLKQNAVFQLFVRKTATVESLRDIIQHLNTELKNIGEKQSAALGTITWLGPSLNEKSPATSWILQPGSFYPDQITHGPLIDLDASIPPGHVSQIQLVTSGVRVDLSDVIKRLHTMITSLEPSMKEQSVGKKLMGSDILLHLSLSPITESNTKSSNKAIEG